MKKHAGSSFRPMSARFACITGCASVAVLAACATTGPPGSPGIDENLPASAHLLETATYRFSLSVLDTRRVPVPGTVESNYPIETWEREIMGMISIADTRGVTLQTGEKLLDGHEPCRIDIAGRIESGDSEFELECGEVRLKLHQVNGEIVEGTGFAWVRTDQGLELCTARNSAACRRRMREGRSRHVTGYSWREGTLRLERTDGAGGHSRVATASSGSSVPAG